MSDLSVTEVQKHLRNFAEKGHDVLSDPQQVILGGKPYGMVLAHTLSLGSRFTNLNDLPRLNTVLMQAERPLLSQVHSNENSVPDMVWPMFRSTRLSGPTYHHDITRKNKHIGVWDSAFSTNKYPSFHEALKAHTTTEITDPGMVDEGINFSDKEALQHVVGVGKPFDKLIRVMYEGPNISPQTHLYNPETEQLTRIH